MQRAVIDFEGVVKCSTFGVLSFAGLGKDGEIALCQAALACTWLCGLHPTAREGCGMGAGVCMQTLRIRSL